MGTRLLRLALLTLGVCWVLSVLALIGTQVGGWVRGASRPGAARPEYVSAIVMASCLALPGVALAVVGLRIGGRRN